MKTSCVRLLTVVVGLSIVCTMPRFPTATANAAEPRVYRQTSIPGTPAPPFTAPPARTNVAAGQTNRAVSAPAKRLSSTLKREIELTDFGAKATWGRTKVFFPNDLSSPIVVITPDGRRLSFKPTFLVLENRATQEAVLLGTVTNRDVGTVYPAANSIVWSNIFDSGPKVSLELVYDGFKGRLEQNILLQESLGTLPDGWQLADVALECWTAWWGDTSPASVQSRSISLRPSSGTNSAIVASDNTVSFGASRITAGGAAFSLDSDAAPLPVAKAWMPAGSLNASPPTSYLIEAVDLLSAQLQIQALPAPVKQSRLELPKRNRVEIGRIQPPFSSQPVRTAKFPHRRMLVANAHSPSTASEIQSSKFIQGSKLALPATRDSRHSSAGPSDFSPFASPGLSPRTSFVTRPAFAIDFTLTEAVPLPPSAISWWPAGANAFDALTNHNDGTPYNGVAYAAGEVGQGFSLDGAAAHVHVADSPSLHLTNAVTVEAWINPASMDEPWYRDIVGKWDLTDGLQQRSYDFSLAPGNSAYIVVTSNGDDSGASWVMTTNAVPFDTWTHIAGVYDGSALRMYVNGSPDIVGAYSSGIFAGTNDLGIGGCVGGGSPGDVLSPFNGAIDEPTIYSRALSPAEIQAIYNAGPAGKVNPSCVQAPSNAVAWWPGDGNAFDVAHTNAGTMRDGATLASGVVGQAFRFESGSQYIQIADNFDLNPTGQLTIEAWVNLESIVGYQPVVRKDGQWDSPNHQFMLGVMQAESEEGDPLPATFRAYLGINGGDYDGYNYLDSISTVQPNTWYHVVEVYDGTNLSIYVNGILDATAPLAGPIITTSEPIFIGLGCLGFADEITIYDRALSDTEIAAVYSAGCAGKCKNWDSSGLLTDLQNSFLGLSSPDDDGDGVPNGVEFYQGRNPRVAGTSSDTGNLINLQVYTPLK